MQKQPPIVVILKGTAREHNWSKPATADTPARSGTIRSQEAVYEYGDGLRTPTQIPLGERPAWPPNRYYIGADSFVPGRYGLEPSREGFDLIAVPKAG